MLPFKERRRIANKKYSNSEKGRLTHRNWYDKNRRKINIYYRKRYKKFKKKILAQHVAHHKRYKEHYYAYKKMWDKTLRGKANAILGRIRIRCNQKHHQNYKYYGGRGIKCFLNVDDIIFLMRRDNADKLRRASIDRIDNDGSYTRRNCRFIEHSENISRNCGGRKLEAKKR